MSAIFRMLVLGALLASPLALAATYADPVSKARFTLPPGWKVRASVANRIRVLKVIPPKADQRERAAIEVQIGVRKPGRSDTLPRLAAMFRQEDGDREAANFVRVNQKAGRLITEYRDGRFVSNRLWIVRHNLHVIQLVDKNRLLEARCTANASEFKTYRRQMESICLSVALAKK
ncbi:hypothetical protein LQR31_14025 [Chromobacterium vaccinii]|uniref:DUF1795 domain-containing protein n=1 Tax=Chromobacterium vaccinii TaxID=1108595 RepID=A0ABV0F9H5_9NEIS|nr:hypothetical protein [Chromobacterium vaccinii]MCD4485591.1 hypothetical protein [Chromobacterium vaccinii]MCD4501737.1 hypothetical protein [Chromobacterium vaccinii]